MCSVHTHIYVHFQFQVRAGGGVVVEGWWWRGGRDGDDDDDTDTGRAPGVGEHPLPAVAASLISLGQLCVVQAVEKTRRQTDGH